MNHHDQAYAWGERRKLTTHPTTGAAQFVEVRETVQEILVPVYVERQEAASVERPLFADLGDDELLGYGVPAEWIDDVRQVNEDQLLSLVDHLPEEAAEALVELATGGVPRVSAPIPDVEPLAHPDAQRRFRVVQDVEELERALDYPWERWMVFLHPAQREMVERDYGGPARVSGSAGTGKTIVALHRAVFLARSNPNARVLLTTYSDALASALRDRLDLLVGNEPRLAERIEVHSIGAVGRRLYRAHGGDDQVASRETIKDLLEEASAATGPHRFRSNFLLSEWEQVVDAWQLRAWRRLPRRSPARPQDGPPEEQRALLWSIFEEVEERLMQQKRVTEFGMFGRLSELLTQSSARPYDFVVVDEAQDMGVAHLRFFAKLAVGRPNALFFAGDLGQRIFQQPFSWRALGIDIRGRSRTLRVNYRTSHQIRQAADRLLDPEQTDADGLVEDRSGTISVFNGMPPTIHLSDDEDAEIAADAAWIKDLIGRWPRGWRARGLRTIRSGDQPRHSVRRNRRPPIRCP